MDTLSLMPHAVCWASSPGLIWTMAITNMITFLSYLTICLTLLRLVRKTKQIIASDWAYFAVGFALFIVACGLTHLADVVTTWIPIFWVAASISIVTALLSAYVSVMLIARSNRLAFGMNDYARRLSSTEGEKQRLQQSLINAQRLEEWSRMSAVVSHEIKNPLQSIQNLQYMIRESQEVPPHIVQMARMAEEEVQRVLTISDSTLSFIRQAAVPERIDLSTAVESVRFLLTPVIREKSIGFSVECRGDCTVEVFAGEARQVLLNVIRNACEASPRGGRVAVELIGSEASVEVMVCDQGPGIDPAILPNLFVFGVTSKGSAGNGMGLWTVKHILQRHSGEVNIENQPAHGVRVRLKWPRDYRGSEAGETVLSEAEFTLRSALANSM